MGLYPKIISIVLLVLGESLAIYAEMIAARSHADTARPAVHIFFLGLITITIASGFLIAGYMIGYRSFQNIWVVSVASITAILIAEPILAYALFHEMPTKGAAIGLVLGAAGFVATVAVK